MTKRAQPIKNLITQLIHLNRDHKVTLQSSGAFGYTLRAIPERLIAQMSPGLRGFVRLHHGGAGTPAAGGGGGYGGPADAPKTTLVWTFNDGFLACPPSDIMPLKQCGPTYQFFYAIRNTRGELSEKKGAIAEAAARGMHHIELTGEGGKEAYFDGQKTVSQRHLFAGLMLQAHPDLAAHNVGARFPTSSPMHTVLFQWAGKGLATATVDGTQLVICPTNADTTLFDPNVYRQPSLTPIHVYFMEPHRYYLMQQKQTVPQLTPFVGKPYIEEMRRAIFRIAFDKLVAKRAELYAPIREISAQIQEAAKQLAQNPHDKTLLDQLSALQDELAKATKQADKSRKKLDTHYTTMQIAFPSLDREALGSTIAWNAGLSPDGIYSLLDQAETFAKKQAMLASAPAEKSGRIELDWRTLTDHIFTLFNTPAGDDSEGLRMGAPADVWLWYHNSSKTWRCNEYVVSQMLNDRLQADGTLNGWIRSGKPGEQYLRWFKDGELINVSVDGAMEATQFCQYNPLTHRTKAIKPASISPGDDLYLLAYLTTKIPHLSPQVMTETIEALIKTRGGIEHITVADWQKLLADLLQMDVDAAPMDCTEVMADVLTDASTWEELELGGDEKIVRVVTLGPDGEPQADKKLHFAYSIKQVQRHPERVPVEEEVVDPSTGKTIVVHSDAIARDDNGKPIVRSPSNQQVMLDVTPVTHGALAAGAEHSVLAEHLAYVCKTVEMPRTLAERLQVRLTGTFSKEHCEAEYEALFATFCSHLPIGVDMPELTRRRAFKLCVYRWQRPEEALTDEDVIASFNAYLAVSAVELAETFAEQLEAEEEAAAASAGGGGGGSAPAATPLGPHTLTVSFITQAALEARRAAERQARVRAAAERRRQARAAAAEAAAEGGGGGGAKGPGHPTS